MALVTRGGLPLGADNNNVIQSKGGPGLSQRSLLNQGAGGKNVCTLRHKNGGKQHPHAVSATLVELDVRGGHGVGKGPRFASVPDDFQVPAAHNEGTLPPALYRLLDPEANVELPPPHKVNSQSLDNRELDKLVAALGRNRATWRRALVLHEWLLAIGHQPDDRLCTTLIRVCHQYGQTVTAMSLYEWMRAPHHEGGAALIPTVYTYTAAMRAALNGNMVEKALKVWDDAIAGGCQPDCRMCTTLIEVCARKGDTQRALQVYETMKRASTTSRLAPSVHAYTAAMRAAAEGGAWQKAMDIWDDMHKAGVQPTGHAFAAGISACAAGGNWQGAVRLFDEMMELQIRPDVVSCTALITALGTDGQWERAERVVDWMMRSGIKPNVRTYTALITAMGNAKQWDRALSVIRRMKSHMMGGIEPNAYTYSALLKTMGEHGKWQLAEELFSELEESSLRLSAEEVGPSGQHNSNSRMGAKHLRSSREGAPAGPQWSGNHMDGNGVRDAGATHNRGGPAGSMGYGAVAVNAAERGLQEQQGSWHAHQPFSYFSGPPVASHDSRSGSAGNGTWTNVNAAMSGLSLHDNSVMGHGYGLAEPSTSRAASSSLLARWGLEHRGNEHRLQHGIHVTRSRGPVNEVVCGALMLAHERANNWEQAVNVLERARSLGIQPNTIMYNTAISALGKAGQWQAAESLFCQIPQPDAVSYETLIAAYGMSGEAAKAEATFQAMYDAGHSPRDYAFCGLIAAHSLCGDWRNALHIRNRMNQSGVAMTVHVYNALIAACERADKCEHALELHHAMQREGIEINNATIELMAAISKKGVAAVENQQAAAAALSAAVAAAGTVLMRTGFF